jgi:hypothetical protein
VVEPRELPSSQVARHLFVLRNLPDSDHPVDPG